MDAYQKLINGDKALLGAQGNCSGRLLPLWEYDTHNWLENQDFFQISNFTGEEVRYNHGLCDFVVATDRFMCSPNMLTM